MGMFSIVRDWGGLVPYFGDMINGEPELRMRFLAFKMDKAVSGGPAVSPEILNRPIRPMLPAPGPVELREKEGMKSAVVQL